MTKTCQTCQNINLVIWYILDLKIEAKSGRICVCADLALEYGFKDLDGKYNNDTSDIRL